MAIKTITVCDGCGEELERTADRYCMFHATTHNFADAAGSRDYNCISLMFCDNCTTNRLLPTLERLAALARQERGEDV